MRLDAQAVRKKHSAATVWMGDLARPWGRRSDAAAVSIGVAKEVNTDVPPWWETARNTCIWRTREDISAKLTGRDQPCNRLYSTQRATR